MNRKLLALAAVAVALPGAARAQSGGYVTLLGRDTIAVESFTWTGANLKGTSVIRTPGTMVRSYELTAGPNGAPQRFHSALARPNGIVAQELTVDYAPDTVRFVVKRDTVTRTGAVAIQGSPLPFFEDVFGVWDAIVRSASGDSVRVFAGPRPLFFTRAKVPGGTSFTWPEWGTFVAQTDAAGHVTGFDLTNTTSKYVVRRVSAAEAQKLVQAMQSGARPLGELSPRDTLKAEVAGAHLLVDYGRPSARGRTIFGGVVPWGAVWRTGANAATQLVTDKDLVIGGATVPAGTYTLFSIPAQSGRWKLAINKQHGQWGTQYDAAQDLARVDLTTTHLAQPVERFTFEVVPAADGGTLAFAWGDTRAAVPVRVK